MPKDRRDLVVMRLPEGIILRDNSVSSRLVILLFSTDRLRFKARGELSFELSDG